MDFSKRIEKLIIPLSILGGIWILLMIWEILVLSPKERAEFKKLNNNYFKEFNYSFSGRVSQFRANVSSNSSIIRLNIKSSDVDIYDPRDTTDFYFVVIKDGIAEVATPTPYQLTEKGDARNIIMKGDSIFFDGKTDSLYLYRSNKFLGRWRPELSNKSYWRNQLLKNINIQ